MRPHLSLDVRNVAASLWFYQKVFGVAPQKQTTGYAKFNLHAPALNCSLVLSTGRISSVDHLGIEVESTKDIAAWEQRLQDLGLLEKVEENTACCFARQDKLWFSNPDGNAWEIFTVHEQLDMTKPLSTTGCCASRDNYVSEPANLYDIRKEPYSTATHRGGRRQSGGRAAGSTCRIGHRHGDSRQSIGHARCC